PLVAMAAPLPCQAFGAEPLDVLRPNLPERQVAERATEDLQDLDVPVIAALVELRVQLEVRRCKLAEADVGLLSDLLALLEDPRALERLDLLRLFLVRRLGRVPVAPAVDREVVEPEVLAARRARAMFRIVGRQSWTAELS